MFDVDLETFSGFIRICTLIEVRLTIFKIAVKMSINVMYNATQQLYQNNFSNYFSTHLFTFFVFFVFFQIVMMLKRIEFVKNFNIRNLILFFGSTEEVMNKLLTIIDSCESTPCNFWLTVIRFVIIDKPEDLQFVLNSPSTLGKSDFYKFFNDVVGEGIFSAPVGKWRKNRRTIAPAFNVHLLENFFEIFNRKNQLLIARLKKELGTDEHFDLWKYISPANLDIICEVAMGFNSDSEETFKEFEEALMKSSEAVVMRVYKPWLHLNIVFAIYAYFTGLSKQIKMIHELPKQIIQQRKEEFRNRKVNSQNDIDNNGSDKFGKTFLDILLDLNEKGAEFTDDDLRDEVITLMIAGSETSALTNCYTLLMLGIHPEIQDKVYEEISGILRPDKINIDMKDVQKMTYLEQCIKETLRLYPVGPIVLRQTSEAIKLSNDFVVPKNTNIVVPPLKVHRNANYYKNPLIWNPDNFSPEETEKRHKYTFLAFSGGPRGCLGARYAMLSMKVTISMILLNYRISTDVRMEDIKLKVDALMRSVDGYRIKLYPRKLA